jgi:hypothetical protein
MPPRERLARVNVEALRAAAATRAATTSITQVAREVGLTTRGLNLFLKGAEPYSATRQKLERWFVRQAADRKDATDADTAVAALAVLAHDVPPTRQAQIVEEAARWWAAKYDEFGIPRPKWIGELLLPMPPPGRDSL